jgi:hypothetical protein
MESDVKSERPASEGHDCQAGRANRIWWIFAAIALFYLLSEHRAHLFGALPYLLLLACPLMHFFMHGRHHHGHDDEETRS